MTIFEANVNNRWGNKSAAARALGLSWQTVHSACNSRHGLSDRVIRCRLDTGSMYAHDVIAVMEGVRRLPADIQRRLRDALQ